MAPPVRLLRRRHIGKPDNPAFGLRDDFLGDDHDVIVLQREWRGLEAVGDQPGQVHALVDHGQAAQSDHLHPVGRVTARFHRCSHG